EGRMSIEVPEKRQLLLRKIKAIAASGQRRTRLGSRAPAAVRWLIALLITAILLSPVIPLAYQAFLDGALYNRSSTFTLNNFSRLFGDERFRAACWNTLWFAIYGTLISTIVGFFAAVILERSSVPMRKTIKILFLAPIFVSA